MITAINMIETGYYKQSVEQIGAEMELVKAAQADARCFEPLYTRYYKQIVAYVYHRIESKEEAFEITAQVFYKTLENLPKYKNQGVPFSAWLFRIASNDEIGYLHAFAYYARTAAQISTEEKLYLF